MMPFSANLPRRMEEWVVVESRRQWPAVWHTERKEQRFSFLDSGVVMLAQRQRSLEEIDVGSQHSSTRTRQQLQRRRRSRVEVGKWWFDKAGLRWDVTYKHKPRPKSISTDAGSRSTSVTAHGSAHSSGGHDSSDGKSDTNRNNANYASCAPVTRQYSAVHNENVFGARPRLVCGVITQNRRSAVQARGHLRREQHGTGDAPARERGVSSLSSSSSSSDFLDVALVTNPAVATRRRWQLPPWALRPVVGTFTGYGDSADTHDPEYAMRDGW